MSFIGQTTLATSTPDLVLQNVVCDPTVFVGSWVRMQNGIAVLASADVFDNSNVIGLVEFKNTSTVCNVRVLGVSEPLFTNLDETKEYLLTVTPGGMGVLAPVNSGEMVVKLGQPYSPERFLVLKGLRLKRS